MNVGIVGQRNNDRAVALAGELAARLGDDDVDVHVDETTATALSTPEVAAFDRVPETAQSFEHCSLVVSIGGDGTFLYAARRAGPTPLLGVNLGEVGFLNAVVPEDAVETVLAELERIRAGGGEFRTMPRIAARGSDWTLEPAINEVVVQGSRRGHGGGANVGVHVGDTPYAQSDADGVMVATPTGSTAYNLSEDGPIVHPDVPAMLLTWMAPERGRPSLVVEETEEIVVTIADAPSAVVVSDGRVRRSVVPPAEITLEVADEPVRIAGPPRTFFGALEKLE